MGKKTATGLERVQAHLLDLTNEVITKFGSGLHSGSPEAVAGQREAALRSILGRFFPKTYELAKGKIYDLAGGVGPSIDIVLLAPNHPRFRNAEGDVEILLADGVHAAIEVKPDITDLPVDFGASRKQLPELVRGLEQIRLTKRLRRTKAGLISLNPLSAQLTEFGHRIPSYIVAGKGPVPRELGQYVADYYVKNSVPVDEQVDGILVLNSGLLLWSKFPEMGYPPIGGGAWRPTAVCFEHGGDSLAAFILHLSSVPGPEASMSEPVMRRYLAALPLTKATFAWLITP